jgi:hypothetical protein
MNQSDRRLSAALHRLGAIAPRGAPPALGEMLKNEFQRHHKRRRRVRNARILLAVGSLAASVALFFLLRLKPHPVNTAAVRDPLPPMTVPLRPGVSEGPLKPAPAPRRSVKKHVVDRSRKYPESAADRFVALPTYDPAIPIDRLEIVRVDLPGRALRLVGFAVNEEVADRRVVADIVLAQDGTPYALRLIQNSPNKEQ